jgi:hypothetical protein
MAIDFYFLLVLTNLILPIKCNSDFFSILNNKDGHLHESPAYKYSQQGNIKQFINMSHFTLFNNNIFLSIISINIIPIILLFVLIPITILRRYQLLLTIFMSFTSDVFLQLFPFIVLSYHIIIQLRLEVNLMFIVNMIIELDYLFLWVFFFIYYRKISSVFTKYVLYIK